MLVATFLPPLCVMLLPLATKLTKSRYARKISNQRTVVRYFERRNHLALRVTVASIQTATVIGNFLFRLQALGIFSLRAHLSFGIDPV
jgi:hypothetical protein